MISLAGAAAALIAVGATHVMWRESFAAPDTPRPAAVATEAHSAWLRARHHLQKRTPQDLDACIRHADDAIRHDARFASGHAVRGACFINTTFLSNVAPAVAFSEVRASARRALALEPQHAGAHVNLAWVLAAAEWAWADAERHFLRALRQRPGFDYARADYGYFLSWLERHEEAIIEAREALRLSPTVPVMSQNLAHVLYLARRYEDALGQPSTESLSTADSICRTSDSAKLMPVSTRSIRLCLRSRRVWPSLPTTRVSKVGLDMPTPERAAPMTRDAS